MLRCTAEPVVSPGAGWLLSCRIGCTGSGLARQLDERVQPPTLTDTARMPLAQLGRAAVSKAAGCRFKSCGVCQALVAQQAEATVSNTAQCGFDPHRAHHHSLPGTDHRSTPRARRAPANTIA